MTDQLIIKPCYVLLEQCTPKAQTALSAELKNAIEERNVLTAKSKKKIFSALDEIDVVNSDDPDAKRCEMKNLVLQEILDTEVTYLKQLEVLSTYFMKPIKEKFGNAIHDVLFGNIGTIYKVNGALLDELKKDLTNVAQAFSRLAPFFKLYSVYAYEFNKAMLKLQDLILNYRIFAKFVNNQETRPEVQMQLSALLIAPIQRIPRYCLLLQQVLENSIQTDPDYRILIVTLGQVQQAASHINTLLAEKESAQRLLELQRCLKGSKPMLIQPGRVLVKEGDVMKFTTDGKPHKRKYCILLSDILMLCDIKWRNIRIIDSLKCELILPLNKCTLKYSINMKMMEIMCENEHLYLYHESGEESEKWYLMLNETISKYIHNRQTLRKESSLRKPAKKKNFDTYSDAGISPYKYHVRKRVEQDTNHRKEASFESEKTSCLPLRPTKRKSLHASAQNSPPKRQKLELRDSLFPLRYHNKREKSFPPIREHMRASTEVRSLEKNGETEAQDNWKITNIFTSISKRFKRFFGYE